MNSAIIRHKAIFLLLVAALTAVGRPTAAQDMALVIEGGTLVDGRGEPPRQNAVVVIEGNRIAAVGEKGAVSYPAGARIIQASGKYVLPGLIDMHVHWDNWMPELFLAHGVTAAADLSSIAWHLTQKEAVATGRMQGPRLFAATAALSGRLLWDLNQTVPVESSQTVRELIQKAGPGRSQYSLTKAYTELTPDQLQALVEEAHKAGRHVIAHLGSLDARQAAETGVDALAHASGIATATITDRRKREALRTFARLGVAVDFAVYLMYHAYMDPQQADQLVSLLVRKNVRLETDLVNTSRYASKSWPDFLAELKRLLADPDLKYIPGDVRERILYDPLSALDSRDRKLLQQGYANLQSFIRKFIRAGGTILAGCDTASFVAPGLCLHQELQLLVEAGLTPMQAIQSATKNNAEFLQESELGTIEPGKLADLIIVRESPLADIRNTRTLETVIQNGKVLDTRYHADFANPLPRPPRTRKFVNPIPSIRAVFPMHSRAPNKDALVTIEGANFVEGAVLDVEGSPVPTTPTKTTMIRETSFHPIYSQLSATIPGRLLAKAGPYRLTVRNPKPEGGVSNVAVFAVGP